MTSAPLVATAMTCLVRFITDSRLTEAHYAKPLRINFIQLQPRRVVIVDRDRSPAEVVRRSGIMATIAAVEGTRVYDKAGDAGASRPASPGTRRL